MFYFKNYKAKAVKRVLIITKMFDKNYQQTKSDIDKQYLVKRFFFTEMIFLNYILFIEEVQDYLEHPHSFSTLQFITRGSFFQNESNR